MTDSMIEPWRPLSPRLKNGLNFGRAAAATYVVVHHVAQSRGLDTGPGVVLRFGQEAVIIFFLLSGFLIYAQEARRVQTDLRGYYLRRARRIYPALLIAIGISAAVAAADSALRERFGLRELVMTLLSVQDSAALKPGVISPPVLQDQPLWSLSYEVVFYIVFPLVMVAWRRWGSSATFATVVVVSIVGYETYLWAPNHWSLVSAYLVMWWSGAWLAHAYRTDTYTVRRAMPAAVAMLVMCLVTAEGLAFYSSTSIGVFPMLQLRHFAFGLIVVVAVSFAPVGRGFCDLSQRLSVPAAWLASISYGLYVFHYPLLINWQFGRTAWGLVIAVVLLVAISVAGDRWLDRHLPRPGRRSSSRAQTVATPTQ